MTRQETLATAVRLSWQMFERFLPGFDDENCTRQGPDLPNHASWTLGHCALTMHRVAERLDGRPLPGGDFVTGDGGAGSPEHYDTESICFGSQPQDDPTQFPTMARAREIMVAAVERLAQMAAIATDEKLDTMTAWGPSEIKLADLVLRVSFHNGTHAGQIIDLRRALKLGSVIG